MSFLILTKKVKMNYHDQLFNNIEYFLLLNIRWILPRITRYWTTKVTSF